MSSVTKINMSTIPMNRVEFAIKDLIEELRYVDMTVKETVCENIADRLAQEGFEYASTLNASAPSNNTTKSVVNKFVAGTYSEISLDGPGAVYDEFGTGEEGLSDPHPMKEQFDLNPYNSGPFVSTHINASNGRHYWIYRPMAGRSYFDENGYTEGVPSGKQMYNTLNHIRKIKGDIVVEEVNDALRTLR